MADNPPSVFSLTEETKQDKDKDKKSAPAEKRGTLTLPQIEAQLKAMFLVGGAFVHSRDKVCGAAILAGAENEAHALIKVAKQNPAIRRLLEGVAMDGAYLELFLATGAILIPILRHHEVPIPFLGKEKPKPTPAQEEPQKENRVPATPPRAKDKAPVTTANWVTEDEIPTNGVGVPVG